MTVKHGEISRLLSAPLDSRDHQLLRHDMIVAKLLGSEGVCRYCLSILSGEDCFALTIDDFVDRLVRFVATSTHSHAESFCANVNATVFLNGFMLNRLHEAENSGRRRRRGKEDRAIALLLCNPRLDDETVREQLKTTERQMNRWSNYHLLRRAIQRQNTRIGADEADGRG